MKNERIKKNTKSNRRPEKKESNTVREIIKQGKQFFKCLYSNKQTEATP